MKIRPLGAEFFHAGGQSDVTKPTVAYRNFEDTPENVFIRVHVRNVFTAQQVHC